MNVAVPPDIPLWLLCPYDTTALDEDVLAEAHRSHPVLVESDDLPGQHRVRRRRSRRRNLRHAGYLHHRAPTTVLTFDPRHHRHVQQILDAATGAGLPVDRATRLAAAIDEFALPPTGTPGM